MARTYEGTHQQYDVVCENNVMVPMRDGVKLATDLYIPAVGERRAEGKFPVIATRTPYNKLSAHGYTTGEFFARRGYIFASQDVRGRFESEGEWYAFAKEAPDGYDTVEWLGSCSDILVFQTPPLAEDMEVTGPIEMHLWASSSVVDTDFTAELIDVHPPSPDDAEGLVINITDSIIRARYRNGWEKAELMEPGQAYEFVFQLYPTSKIFPQGHRIRLDISSSNWPRFDVNPNTGGPLGRHRSWQVAHQSVYHDGGRPSHIVLPLQTPKGR